MRHLKQEYFRGRAPRKPALGGTNLATLNGTPRWNTLHRMAYRVLRWPCPGSVGVVVLVLGALAGAVSTANNTEAFEESTAHPTVLGANEKNSRVYGSSFADEASFCSGYLSSFVAKLDPPAPESIEARLARAGGVIESHLLVHRQLSTAAQTEGRRRNLEDLGYSPFLNKPGSRKDTLVLTVVRRCEEIATCLESNGACEYFRAPVGAEQRAPSTPSLARTAWLEKLRWSTGCEDAYRRTYDSSEGGIDVYPLGKRSYVVKVLCTGGAHLEDMNFFFYDEAVKPAKSHPLRFRMKTSTDAGQHVEIQVLNVSGYSEYDERTKRLLLYSSFLNHEDCAELHVYEFEGGAPRLVSYRPPNPKC